MSTPVEDFSSSHARHVKFYIFLKNALVVLSFLAFLDNPHSQVVGLSGKFKCKYLPFLGHEEKLSQIPAHVLWKLVLIRAVLS